jgi:catalase
MASSSPRLGAVVAIAAAPIALIAGFAWAGGWIGAPRISGGAMIDSLQYNAGTFPGYRRAHTKGVCFSGEFIANGAGEALTKAPMLAAGSYQMFGRFSTGGSDPFSSDGRPTFHAMALQIRAPNHEIWRMAMDHTPIFPVSTPAAFVALQHASKPVPGTGKPDPALMKAYLAKYPETKRFLDYMATMPLPNSFANGTYYSINAFRFTNAAGKTQTVRWSFVPEAPFGALDKATLDNLPKDYLFDDIAARLQKGPQRWHMFVTLPDPGDVTNNATIAWPASRRKIEVGTLVLQRAEPEETGPCRDITFDPTILPGGVSLSDDPLLSARSAAYSASFRRRATENPGTSAVGKTLNGGH